MTERDPGTEQDSAKETTVTHASSPMIELSGVGFAYEDAERFTLANLDLRIDAGTVTGIVGASGAGKTTLAKALAKVFDVHFARVQFTPDLLPGDIHLDAKLVVTASMIDVWR